MLSVLSTCRKRHEGGCNFLFFDDDVNPMINYLILPNNVMPFVYINKMKTMAKRNLFLILFFIGAFQKSSASSSPPSSSLTSPLSRRGGSLNRSRPACRFFVWDAVSAGRFHMCNHLLKDRVYEGLGGKKVCAIFILCTCIYVCVSIYQLCVI